MAWTSWTMVLECQSRSADDNDAFFTDTFNGSEPPGAYRVYFAALTAGSTTNPNDVDDFVREVAAKAAEEMRKEGLIGPM